MKEESEEAREVEVRLISRLVGLWSLCIVSEKNLTMIQTRVFETNNIVDRAGN